MTRAAIIQDLKTLIGPGIEVDDAGLAVWINDAYMQMVDQVKQVNPDFYTKASTTSSVAGQGEYALPTDFEQVLMATIKLEGVWQRAVPIATINEVPNLSQSDAFQGFMISTPGYYIIGDQIGFLPVPEETTSNSIKLWYTYTPQELDEDGDEPALPKKFHHILKYGAYATYLDQDDEHVAAERMRQRFEARIFQMLESMATNQLDEPKSVTVTSGQELYFADDEGWV